MWVTPESQEVCLGLMARGIIYAQMDGAGRMQLRTAWTGKTKY